MLTRTLIFVPENVSFSKNLRGVVSLSGDGVISGKMKLYNIDASMLPLVLAVQVGNKKAVFSDIKNYQDYDFIIQGDIAEDVILALGCMEKNGIQTIAVAKNNDKKVDYSSLFETSDKEIEEIIDKTMIDEVAKSQSVLGGSIFDGLTQITKKLNEETDEDQDLKKEAKLFEDFDKEAVPTTVIPKGQFYSLIEPQLNELFTRFPHFEELEKNVENTEWIKVTYSNNGELHYILGKLFENGIVSHLCYGIPAENRTKLPPNDLVEYCQWLPLHLDNIDGQGYWVMYQRADTGENVHL